MPPPSQQTLPQDWQQWLDLCAYAKCPSDTQTRLADLASSRLRKYFYAAANKLDFQIPDAVKRSLEDNAYCFLRLEESLCTGTTRDGLTYKDDLHRKLLSSTDDPVNTAQGIITLHISGYITKAFVSEIYVQRKGQHAIDTTEVTSKLDQELGQRYHSILSIEDFSDEEDGILRQLAVQEAAALVEEMDRVQKVAFCATSRRVPIYRKDVLDAAGCGRDKIYRVQSQFISGLEGRMTQRYPQEDRSSLKRLIFHLITSLAEQSAESLKSEKIPMDFFYEQTTAETPIE